MKRSIQRADKLGTIFNKSNTIKCFENGVPKMSLPYIQSVTAFLLISICNRKYFLTSLSHLYHFFLVQKT